MFPADEGEAGEDGGGGVGCVVKQLSSGGRVACCMLRVSFNAVREHDYAALR